MATPVAVLVRDETLRAAARSQACAIDMVSPYSMESVAAYIEHLEALVDTANISISEAQSKLDEQTPLIEKACRDLQEGAIELRTARNAVLRVDTEARRADAYAMELRSLLEHISDSTLVREGIAQGCSRCLKIAALAKNQRGEAAASSAEGSTGTTTPAMILSRPSPTPSDDARTVARPKCGCVGHCQDAQRITDDRFLYDCQRLPLPHSSFNVTKEKS